MCVCGCLGAGLLGRWAAECPAVSQGGNEFQMLCRALGTPGRPPCRCCGYPGKLSGLFAKPAPSPLPRGEMPNGMRPVCAASLGPWLVALLLSGPSVAVRLARLSMLE